MITIDDIIEDYGQPNRAPYTLTTLQLKHFNDEQAQKFNNQQINIRGTVENINENKILLESRFYSGVLYKNGIERYHVPITVKYHISTDSLTSANLLDIYVGENVDVEGTIMLIDRHEYPSFSKGATCNIFISPRSIIKVIPYELINQVGLITIGEEDPSKNITEVSSTENDSSSVKTFVKLLFLIGVIAFILTYFIYKHSGLYSLLLGVFGFLCIRLGMWIDDV